MYSILIFFTVFLTNFFSIIYAITYSDTHDYDAYGTRIASTDYFVVLAQNDGLSLYCLNGSFWSDNICVIIIIHHK